jgi:multiple sugar transport system permease protein
VGTSSFARREALAFYAFISPWLIGFVLLVAGPLLASFLLSFTAWDMASPPVYVGLGNYVALFTADKLLGQSLSVTVIWVVVGLPLRLVVAYLAALALNQRLPAISLFRTIFYLPAVVSGVAIALLWVWILQPQYGLLNSFLRLLGMPGPAWLGSEEWALPGFIIMSVWSTGAAMVIFLAGLQNVPVDLYEAAEIDGANALAKLFRVTIPMTTPVILFNVIIGLIQSFQVFTQAFVMTDGGPNNATLFYVLYLYRVAFRYHQMGYASAMAWILFLIILACTLLVFRSSARWVYYEGEAGGRA